MLRIAAAVLAITFAPPLLASAQEPSPAPPYVPEDPLRSYGERTNLPDIAAINAKAADEEFRRAVGFYVGRNPGMGPRDWIKLEQAKADKAAKDAAIKTSAKAEDAKPAK